MIMGYFAPEYDYSDVFNLYAFDIQDFKVHGNILLKIAL